MYDRDYAADVLPAVEPGDRVRVEYVSRQNGSRQSREGEVVEVHANGFAVDCGRAGLATGVRVHPADKSLGYEYETGDPVHIRVSTIKDHGDGYGHSANLNRLADPVDVERV